MNQKYINTAHVIGALLTFSGAVMQLVELSYAKYVFAAGALLLLVLQVFFVIKSNNKEIRIRRINRMMLFATAMLAVAAYMMFTRPYSNSWVVMVLIYAVLSVFFTFRVK